MQEGKKEQKQVLQKFEEAQLEYAQACEKVNDGHNGLITYIMATMSAEKYKEYNKVIQISENSSFSLKGDEELKNIRKRADGRYEWRKQINHISYQKINRNRKELEKEVRQLLKLKTINIDKNETKKTFIELATHWYDTYKKDIKSGKEYKYYIDARFNQDIFKQRIDRINYEQLEHFINSIKEHRVASYCYFIIRGVYKEALKREYVKKDISELITKPKNKTVKGDWFTVGEQKLILDHLDETPIKYEILFYLLTGCRRNEALNMQPEAINFDRLTIFIDGTKTKSAKRYVPISEKFASILKSKFNEMFRFKQDYYSRMFQAYLQSLGIKNKKLHDLRHTYNSNLYYLGVLDKERQYYLGHSSIVITNDIYTHLDLTVKKEDILNLYKDLYPKF